MVYSEYFSARKALWQLLHTAPSAFTFAVIAASSLAFAASANSFAAALSFPGFLLNSSNLSQISGFALVLPVSLPFGKKPRILSALLMIFLALASTVV